MEIPRIFFPTKVLYVWTLIALAMIVYVIVWFSMGIVVMTFVDTIAAAASNMWNNATWDMVVEFIRNCFLIHPLIALVGWFVYGVVNSLRRDVEQHWKT